MNKKVFLSLSLILVTGLVAAQFYPSIVWQIIVFGGCIIVFATLVRKKFKEVNDSDSAPFIYGRIERFEPINTDDEEQYYHVFYAFEHPFTQTTTVARQRINGLDKLLLEGRKQIRVRWSESKPTKFFLAEDLSSIPHKDLLLELVALVVSIILLAISMLNLYE